MERWHRDTGRSCGGAATAGPASANCWRCDGPTSTSFVGPSPSAGEGDRDHRRRPGGGGTKTKAGRRTATLPRRVVAELEQHRRAYPSPALVFTSPEGNQVRSGNLRRRHRAPAVARAGLDGFTFHDMRHAAVSLWVAAGASDLDGAKWAGHTSAAFTKSRYAHLSPSTVRRWPNG
ncbi:MAG TPA: site-specific integrase [Acidimicrobiales bacterium]|nr:site-specific integrase [Acidimicrobiales bacterium]